VNLRKFDGFNIEKIIQVLAYIQKRIDCRDKLKLIKLLFFADRTHLRKGFGLISSDIYSTAHSPSSLGAAKYASAARQALLS
jgi:hypothetical protein